MGIYPLPTRLRAHGLLRLRKNTATQSRRPLPTPMMSWYGRRSGGGDGGAGAGASALRRSPVLQTAWIGGGPRAVVVLSARLPPERRKGRGGGSTFAYDQYSPAAHLCALDMVEAGRAKNRHLMNCGAGGGGSLCCAWSVLSQEQGCLDHCTGGSEGQQDSRTTAEPKASISASQTGNGRIQQQETIGRWGCPLAWGQATTPECLG